MATGISSVLDAAHSSGEPSIICPQLLTQGSRHEAIPDDDTGLSDRRRWFWHDPVASAMGTMRTSPLRALWTHVAAPEWSAHTLYNFFGFC